MSPLLLCRGHCWREGGCDCSRMFWGPVVNAWTPKAQLWHLFVMLQDEIAQGRESLVGLQDHPGLGLSPDSSES